MTAGVQHDTGYPVGLPINVSRVAGYAGPGTGGMTTFRIAEMVQCWRFMIGEQFLVYPPSGPVCRLPDDRLANIPRAALCGDPSQV